MKNKHLLTALAFIIASQPLVAKKATKVARKPASQDVEKFLSSKKNLAELQDKSNRINSSIDVTRNRIKNQKDAQFAPDLFFMLGELFHDKSVILSSIKKEKNPNLNDSDLDFTQEKQLLGDAAEQFKIIEDRYPEYASIDRAVYTLAVEYKLMDDSKASLDAFKRVTQKFPKSIFAAKAFLEVGNYFYQKRDFAFAEENFLKAEALGFEPERSEALLKIGLSNIQLEKWPTSISAFEKIYKKSTLNSSETQQIEIIEQALIGSVWPLLELSGAQLMQNKERANYLTYYKLNAPSKSSLRKALIRLTERMEIKKRSKESLDIYWEIFKLSDLVEEKKSAFENAYLATKKLKTSFPFWVSKPTTDLIIKLTSPQVESKFKGELAKYEVLYRDILTSHHNLILKTKRPEELTQLAESYEDYLMIYPKSKFSSIMRLNLAELYFLAEQFHKAGKNYLAVGRTPTSEKINKQQTLLSSLESFLKGSSNLKLPNPDLMQNRMGYKMTALAFKKAYPNDKKVTDILFNVAKISYDEQNFDMAEKQLLSFLKTYPQTPQTKNAALLYLDCFYLRNQQKKMASAGKMLLGLPLDQSTKTSIQQAVNQAELKSIRSIAGDFGSANYAKKFREFARKNKNSQLGEQALYEAVLSMRAQRNPMLYELGEEYISNYPQNPRSKELLLSMIQQSLNEFDFSKAANYLFSFSERFSQEGQSQAFAEQAGILYDLIGKSNEAYDAFELAGQSSKGLLALAKHQDWGLLSKKSTQAKGLLGQYYQGLALYRLKQGDTAERLLEQVARSSGSSDEEKLAVAHSAIILAEKYRTILAQARSGVFSPQALQERSTIYQKVYDYSQLAIDSQSGSWVIAGVYNQAMANQLMSQALNGFSPPAGINPAQFKTMIGQQVTTYKQTSMQLYKQGYQLATDSKLSTYYAIGCANQSIVTEAKDQPHYPPFKSDAGSKTILAQLSKSFSNIDMLKSSVTELMQKGYPQLAMGVLIKAAEVAPNDSEVYSLQGAGYLHFHDLASAQNLFEKALTINPSDSIALSGLSGLFEQFGYKNLSQSYRSKFRSLKTQNLHPWIR